MGKRYFRIDYNRLSLAQLVAMSGWLGAVIGRLLGLFTNRRLSSLPLEHSDKPIEFAPLADLGDTLQEELLKRKVELEALGFQEWHVFGVQGQGLNTGAGLAMLHEDRRRTATVSFYTDPKGLLHYSATINALLPSSEWFTCGDSPGAAPFHDPRFLVCMPRAPVRILFQVHADRIGRHSPIAECRFWTSLEEVATESKRIDQHQTESRISSGLYVEIMEEEAARLWDTHRQKHAKTSGGTKAPPT